MNASQVLVIVGAGPVLDIARSIATARGDAFTTAELSPDKIHASDVGVLVGRPPAATKVFAAMGLHALNHARSDLVAQVKRAGFTLVNLIHPSASVDPTATIGPNVLIGATAGVGPKCELGEGCVTLDGARIEAGARIGAYAWIGANVDIGFGASVGDHTILRPGVHLDAGVSVGHHCELSTSGLRQAAVGDRVFETATFDSARIYGGIAR